MPEWLAQVSQAEVRLGCVVQEIEYAAQISPSSCRVSPWGARVKVARLQGDEAQGATESGSARWVEADWVVCTAPLGVLKASSIRFTPPLPRRKMESIQGMGSGALEKVTLVFDVDFWSSIDKGVRWIGFSTDGNSAHGTLFDAESDRSASWTNGSSVVAFPWFANLMTVYPPRPVMFTFAQALTVRR